MPRDMKMGMGGKMMGPMMDPRTRFFMALANDHRLKMIELLKDGEKSSSEIMDALGLYASVVSRHLTMLRNVGIVASRKEGVIIYFRLADENVLKIIDIAGDIIKNWYEQRRELFNF